jgi:hypothetical protein
MTLEFAILSEQKLVNIILNQETNRGDNALLGNRVDASAEAMAMPADPRQLGHTVGRSHADAA